MKAPKRRQNEHLVRGLSCGRRSDTADNLLITRRSGGCYIIPQKPATGQQSYKRMIDRFFAPPTGGFRPGQRGAGRRNGIESGLPRRRRGGHGYAAPRRSEAGNGAAAGRMAGAGAPATRIAGQADRRSAGSRHPAPGTILPRSATWAGAAGSRQPAPRTILPESATFKTATGDLVSSEGFIVAFLWIWGIERRTGPTRALRRRRRTEARGRELSFLASRNQRSVPNRGGREGRRACIVRRVNEARIAPRLALVKYIFLLPTENGLFTSNRVAPRPATAAAKSAWWDIAVRQLIR